HFHGLRVDQKVPLVMIAGPSDHALQHGASLRARAPPVCTSERRHMQVWFSLGPDERMAERMTAQNQPTSSNDDEAIRIRPLTFRIRPIRLADRASNAASTSCR